MKNTGTEYMSTECKPTVRQDFAELLPPLTDEQLSLLEADILKNGCYAPIIVNEELIVVDGHNRKEICDKHGLPYRMAVFSFADDLEAKQWALDTQKGRRNLEKWELGKIALKLKPDIEARADANRGSRNDLRTTLSEGSEDFVPTDTKQELADAVGLSRGTMNKVIQIDEKAPEPVKEALDNDEISIHQGYNITRAVSELPEDEREQAAAAAVAREIARKNDKKLRKIDSDTKTAKLFCAAFEKGVQVEATEENVRAWLDYAGVRAEHFDSLISDARQIADAFAAIAEIITKIKPKDWRASNEAEAEHEADTDSGEDDNPCNTGE